MIGEGILCAISSKLWKKLLLASALAVFLTAGYHVAARTEAFELIEQAPFHQEIRLFLLEKVADGDPIPPSEGLDDRAAMIYVLGGSQGSLERRFMVAASLYRQGYGKKVFIMSRPGFTEREPGLTNDAWALRALESLGVPEADIEPLNVTEETFGTMSEARTVPGFAHARGFGELAIVTSVYHTKRARECFSVFMPKGMRLKAYPAPEDPGIRGLAREFGKLVFYRMFLI